MRADALWVRAVVRRLWRSFRELFPSCLLVVALITALVPVWLLYSLVDARAFWTVIVGSMATAPAGAALPRLCNSQRMRPPDPMRGIFSAIAVALLLNCSLALVKILVLQKRSLNRGDVLEELLCTASAIAGIAINMSLGGIVFYDVWVTKSEMRRQAYRKLLKLVLPEERAKVVLCDCLEDEASGNCAICLAAFHDLPPEEAWSRDLHGSGLLRLPCQHTFHGVCAEPWLEREGTCPICRQSCGRKRTWTRICLRTPQRAGASKQTVHRDTDQARPDDAESV